MGRDVTDEIERALFDQAELNYMSGATALVKQEIALTQRSLYRKPSRRFTLWNNANAARIDGRWGKPATETDFGRNLTTYSNEDYEETSLNRDRRDAGSQFFTNDIDDELEVAPRQNLIQIAHNKRNLLP